VAQKWQFFGTPQLHQILHLNGLKTYIIVFNLLIFFWRSFKSVSCVLTQQIWLPLRVSSSSSSSSLLLQHTFDWRLGLQAFIISVNTSTSCGNCLQFQSQTPRQATVPTTYVSLRHCKHDCRPTRSTETVSFPFYRAAWNACRRGLAMRIPSVRLSVKHVNCDKTKKNLSRFLYHRKDHSA